MQPSELQRVILRALAENKVDKRLGRGEHYLFKAIPPLCPPEDKPGPRDVQEAVWALIGRGLAFIDISQAAPENWMLNLSRLGYAAASDKVVNPDDPASYLSQLYSDVPTMSDVVRLYLEEAVQTYYHECYLASTVMLGVAAEAAFLELSTAFAKWLGGTPGTNLEKIIADTRRNYVQKFSEFRRRLDPLKPQLPGDLADAIDLQMNSVLELLRVSRNDAGHPTGVTLSREACFTNLRIFASLISRIYKLKLFFENP
jgi:hypothetical protein